MAEVAFARATIPPPAWRLRPETGRPDAESVQSAYQRQRLPHGRSLSATVRTIGAYPSGSQRTVLYGRCTLLARGKQRAGGTQATIELSATVSVLTPPWCGQFGSGTDRGEPETSLPAVLAATRGTLALP
jgi:hypothetical protein